MHVEFLDIYMIFPLVLLGIDKIVKEKNYKLYVISLAFTIFFNYYFAYMILIFSMIYFNYRILNKKIDKKDFWKKNLRFIVVSILVCITMSFVFLPIASEIGSYSRGDAGLFGGLPFKFAFNLQDIVNYYFIGNFVTITVLNPSDYYLYTSIVVLPLLYFYFINPKFPIREKILTGIVFVILFISISINYVNYMWHGFSPPFCINGRFTFMFILFILMICTKSIYYLKQIKVKQYWIAFSLVYFAVFLYNIIDYPRIIDAGIIAFFFLLYLFTTFLSLFLMQHPKYFKYFGIGSTSIIALLFVLAFFIPMITFPTVLKVIMYFFCVLLISALSKKKNLSWKHFLYLFLLFLIPYSIFMFYKNRIIMGDITIIKISILFFFLLILKYISKKKNMKKAFLLLIVIELLINGYHYLHRFTYQVDVDSSYGEVIEEIKKNDSSTFYRIENNYDLVPRNDAILYQYYGIDYFISSIKEDFVNFFIDSGVKNPKENINSVQFDGSYHLLASLLNVKYNIEMKSKETGYSFNVDENNYYTKLGHISHYDYYLNEDSLSLGYMVNPSLLKLEKKGDGLAYQNDIYKSMTNTDKNIFEKIDLVKTKNNSYSFTNTSDRDFYFLVELEDWEAVSQINVYINDELLKNVSNHGIYRIHNTYGPDESITIKIQLKFYQKKTCSVTGVHAYYYNHDVYKEDINLLKENQFEVTKVENNSLEGTMNTKEDGLFFISCLYNEDLDLYVDGEKQDKEKLLNAFIGTELKKGKHKIVLKYKPRILYISFVPSIMGLALLLLYLKRLKKQKG